MDIDTGLVIESSGVSPSAKVVLDDGQIVNGLWGSLTEPGGSVNKSTSLSEKLRGDKITYALNDAQKQAWEALYGGLTGGERYDRYKQLSNLYNQEEKKFAQGYALTTDRELRDQYRDAWKTLYNGTTYTNPYMTGDWYGNGATTGGLSQRADNWKNEVGEYRANTAVPATAATSPTAANAVVQTLNNIAGGGASGISAKGTRSTYGGTQS